MFAVIELQWHQYIVREDDTIVVDKLELTDSSYTAEKVLLVAEEDGSNVTIWSPYIEGMGVVFDVITDFQKGEKVRVLKFKRKNRYQRIIWFRPHQTVLCVSSIGKTDWVASSKKVKKVTLEEETIKATKEEKTTKEEKKPKTEKVAKPKTEKTTNTVKATKSPKTEKTTKPVTKKATPKKTTAKKSEQPE